MEISNMLDKQFKTMVKKWLLNLRGKWVNSETVNKEIKMIKNTPEGIGGRLEDAEDRFSDLEDRVMESAMLNSKNNEK